VEGALLRAWVQRGWLAWLLWPISLVLHALVMLRRQLFRWGLMKVQRVDALVIVVGNVVAGGAGKTPTVISVVQHLTARQRKVGVISRGYGRQSDACMEVTPDSAPAEVGDEPALLRRATQVPVFVGRNRHATATALLAQYPQTEIIVCDDGLQHYRLYRDLEICVFDDRGCGNGWLLPAGPLREPWPRVALPPAGQHPSRLLVLHTGSHPAFAGFTAHRSLDPLALRQDGTRIPLATLNAPGTPPLMAVAGIAQPQAFFAMLQATGLTLAQTVALPDHYDFDSLPRSIHKGYQLICTEKDALKLWRSAPDALAIPLVQTAAPAFFQALDARIVEQQAATLSSPHGHKTS
jgi:tetraacyldisaccharide 4'-kinase